MGLDEIQDGKDYTRSGSGNLTCFDDRKWKYRKRVWKGKHQIIKNIRIKLIFKHEQWTSDYEENQCKKIVETENIRLSRISE